MTERTASNEAAVQPLRGQVALVTGAATGIGKASVHALAAAGAAVAINFRSKPEAAEEIATEIRDNGGTALTVGADVSVEDDVETMFETTVRELGTVDILVSNAGLERPAAFHEMTLDDWQKVVNVNLTGSFLCARAAVREFLRRGPRPEVSAALGKIVFMSSVHDIIPWASNANYAASKGGLVMLAKSMAQELAGRKIRVNVVSPGAIKTPINKDSWSDPQEHRELLELIPYGRVGNPEDVANAVAWLASDASDYVTGATLVIDGGMALYPAFRDGG